MNRQMKETSIPGIDVIPNNWDTCPMKTIFSFGKGLSITKDDLSEEGLPVLSYGQIHSKNNPKVTTPPEFLRHIPVDKAKKQSLTNLGDFIFADTSEDREGCGNCNYVDADGIYAGYHTIIAKAKDSVENKYFGYLFLTDAWRFQIRRELTEVKLYSVSQKVLKNTVLLLPPAEERKHIVSFLDRKCSAIDSAIEKTKESIEKLEEYKKAVITKAVTKGLNPDAKMKDSGIEWIGEVPEEWNFVKLTFITDAKHPYPIGDGDHGLIKNDRYVEDGVPYIRVQNLGWGDELSLKNTVCITEEDNARIINSELHPGDVLFAKTGATIGKVSLVPQTISRANTTSHVGKITLCNKYLPKYILYVLSSTVAYRQLWEIAGRKATRPELSIDEIKDMRLLLTQSLKEQNEIVSYLDNKCSAIDNLITKKNETINKWEEYKKSLIYYAVTGKIDCRNEVI